MREYVFSYFFFYIATGVGTNSVMVNIHVYTLRRKGCGKGSKVSWCWRTLAFEPSKTFYNYKWFLYPFEKKKKVPRGVHRTFKGSIENISVFSGALYIHDKERTLLVPLFFPLACIRTDNVTKYMQCTTKGTSCLLLKKMRLCII